jgi:hypothetical protein
VELTSDVPITGAVRADWGGSRRDTSWLSATPTVRSANPLAGAAAVPAGTGLETSVTVAAPKGPVSGTLEVLATGAAEDSPFTADGPLASGDLGERDESGSLGLQVLTEAVTDLPAIRVSVPAGSQRVVPIPDLDAAALAHLTWTSSAGSGPALLSHVTLATDPVAATGYSWWPTESAVVVKPVREDIGTLVPGG